MYLKTRLHLAPMVHTMERSLTPGLDMANEFRDLAEDYGVPVPRMDGSGTLAEIQGTALEAGSVVIDKCLSRSFVAAYLLTGSAKQAEAVLSESIQHLDIAATRDGCLSWKAIAAAIKRGGADSESTLDEAPPALPAELLRVLRLSPRLRQCFVVRLLMAMPRHYCAGLLRIDARQVDAYSCLAAQELARIVAREAEN
jgi:hypothetical protein